MNYNDNFFIWTICSYYLAFSLKIPKPTIMRNVNLPSTSTDPVQKSMAAMKLEKPLDEKPVTVITCYIYTIPLYI